jgi:photosystem II stability/assembly factor-like uncharacterized protein
MKTINLTTILFILTNICFSQYWNEINSGVFNDLNCITFSSQNVGYIGGDDSTLLKTTDGGLTWQQISHIGINYNVVTDIVDIQFVSDSIGFVAIQNSDTLIPYSGGVYKTEDGGLSWTADVGFMCDPYKLYRFDENNGYNIGSSCFAGNSIDRKTNGVWTSFTTHLGGYGYMRAIDFYAANYGIVGGDDNYIYRTLDGQNWDTLNILPLGAQNSDFIVNDIEYINASVLIASTNEMSKLFYYSLDSGKTWQSHVEFTFSYPRINSITHSKKDSIINVGFAFGFGSHTGIIYHYDYNLQKYVEHYNTKGAYNEVIMKNDSIAFIVGDSGSINSNISTIPTNIPEDVTESFSIYPNPNYGTFNINVEDPSTIEVFDINGKIVGIQSVNKGANHIRTNISPGVYFLQKKNAKGVQTQRIIIK